MPQPKMKRKDRKKGGRKQPFDVAAPIESKKQLKKEVKAAQDVQFSPTEYQLDAEMRASQMRSAEIPPWFTAYQEAIQRAATNTATHNSNVAHGVEAYSTAAGEKDKAAREQLAVEGREDAARRGAVYNPANDELAQAASAARRMSAEQWGANLATQSNAQYAYLQDRARIGAGEMINQLNKEAARGRSIQADKREVAREKGTFGVDYRAKLREQAQDQAAISAEASGDKAYQKFATKQQKRGIRAEKKDDLRSLGYLDASTAAAAGLQDQKADDAIAYGKKFGGGGKEKKGGSTAFGVDKGVSRVLARLNKASEQQISKVSRHPLWREAYDHLVTSGASKQVAREAADRAFARFFGAPLKVPKGKGNKHGRAFPG